MEQLLERNYLFLLLFMCLISIALGIIRLMNLDNWFNGLILTTDGQILDPEKYFDSDEGKEYMTKYINDIIHEKINLYKLETEVLHFKSKNKVFKLDSNNQINLSNTGSKFYLSTNIDNLT